MKKRLPIGISDFETLITGGNVYVDKTPLIYRLVTEGMFYFLSRPRRFGKSLLLSTFKALFQGKRKLFEGLWISQSDWQWESYPVIEFNFSEIDLDTPEQLRAALMSKLHRYGKEVGVQVHPELLRHSFSELIIGMGKKYGRPVVVLVDEYDQPLINHLGKGEKQLEVARQNREILRSFFGVLKGGNVAPWLRFVFITGISKFTRVSLFSGLNNLKDLTMHAGYAELLGYTHEELKHYFTPWLKEFAHQKGVSVQEILNGLETWYNGYRFSRRDVRVYNPFSILNALEEFEFKNYWFETATSTFLLELIKERNFPVPDLEHLEMSEEDFTTYDIDRLQLAPLLFQTGYLTIQDYDGVLYRL
ncbi:MAG: AAA family ATPase, partial [Calditrichaeota bacterium]